MLFQISVEQDEQGYFVAECPMLPGCVTQGDDEKQALENIKEAIEAWFWAENQKQSEKLAIQGKNKILVAV